MRGLTAHMEMYDKNRNYQMYIFFKVKANR